MSITADLLQAWGERICTLPATEARELVRELDLGGQVVPRLGALAVEPPLAGAVEVRAIERRERFERLDLKLDPSGARVTRAELEARLGSGVEVPRIHAGYFTLVYRLDRPGAPFGCDVSAEFAAEPATEPAWDTPASGISLRRQPARLATTAPSHGMLGQLVEALATATARLRQDDGAELRRRVEEVRDHVAHFGQAVATAGDGEEGRREAAAELEKLVAAVGKAGAAAGRAVARQGEAVRQVIGALDLGALTEALRRFTALLASQTPAGQTPTGHTPNSQARIKELLAQLERAVGGSFGTLFAAEGDEIFRGKKNP